ncbi:protein kinase [Stieleria sp. ICT_E10.1]|uniref:protein kinase n=1 Tax=Stieleria sedimenti TaxID=2976331 RepID=UPI00217F87CC|nr:protein kinase [Stieleria sedimenti]MCS7468706.1 protein kinase [Stieleria sedimenti]
MPPSNDHPTPEEWIQFLSGKLCSDRAKELEEHCNRCPSCSMLLESHSESVGNLSLVPWDDAAQTLDVQSGSTPGGEEFDIPKVICCDTVTLYEAGTELGPYRLQSVIGQGGNGVVYRAVQQHPIRRTVAIKVAKRAARGTDRLERFLLEHQTLSRLKHPGLPHVYDVAVEENAPRCSVGPSEGVS